MKRLSVIAALLFTATLGVRNAQAYKVIKTSDGKAVRWGTAQVTVEIEGDMSKDAGPVAEAFYTWAAALAPRMLLDVRESEQSKLSLDARDGKNAVVWLSGRRWDEDMDEDALAVTFTTYRPSTGTITDADVAINAKKYRWVSRAEDGCEGEYDLQNVLTHEAGHFLGLEHSDDRQATMYAKAAPCETKKRRLGDDDTAGVAFLYGETWQPTTDAPGGVGCSAAGPASRRLDARAGLLMTLLAAASLVLRRRNTRKA